MFSAAIKRLSSLPVEVVHKILTDIQLVRILHILCVHDEPYVEACVASHYDIGKVLPAERLSKIKQFFMLYLDIIRLHRHPALDRPHIAPLECDAQTFAGKGGSADSVISYQYDPFHEALQPHASGPIPSLYQVDATDVGSLRHMFEALNGAEQAMNKKKSDQLKRLAQMMIEYPLSLKMLSDRSQEVRRNDQHRIDQLMVLSERMLHGQILDQSFVATRYFAMRGLFVVPYDRLLRGFLKVLKRYPEDKHEYPPEMVTVMQGMRQIYVRSEAGRYMRTKYTRYGEEGACGLRQPQFNNDYARNTFENVNERIQPLDERELTWLEGFLSVCRHMRGREERWWTGHIDYH
ncbi:hypothetical protein F5887DRAFT_959883 [Amanita rubescens]|nr:hypothetical protein F5887DRAFT_959883 [Amanita rubescens]